MFTEMGIDGFGHRARHELLAGATPRRSRTQTRGDLTSQARHIAWLTRDGRSNPKIGARLFLSPRTVDWNSRLCSPSWGSTPAGSWHTRFRPPTRVRFGPSPIASGSSQNAGHGLRFPRARR